MKKYFLWSLHAAPLIWGILAVEIIITSLLYAILSTVGMQSAASLLISFLVLVGLILLSFSLMPKSLFKWSDVSGMNYRTTGQIVDIEEPSFSSISDTEFIRSSQSKNMFSASISAEFADQIRISVVIPARNEAQNLPYILPLIPPFVNEVILVDGHSTDDTIEEAQRVFPEISVLTQPGKGIGDALRTGIAACTGDIIVVLYANGKADPNEMPRFIEALLAGSYWVKGSRFIVGGGSSDMTLLRRLGSRILTKVVNILFGVRFTDFLYGYVAFWKDSLDFIEIDDSGFEAKAIMNIRVLKANLELFEVPSYEYARVHGTSNLSTFRDGWRILQAIIKEWIKSSSSLQQPVSSHRQASRFVMSESWESSANYNRVSK